jgi:hypothetical protein
VTALRCDRQRRALRRAIEFVALRKPGSSASGEKSDRQIAAGACQPSGPRLAMRADLDAARVAGLTVSRFALAAKDL